MDTSRNVSAPAEENGLPYGKRKEVANSPSKGFNENAAVFLAVPRAGSTEGYGKGEVAKSYAATNLGIGEVAEAKGAEESEVFESTVCNIAGFP